MVSISLPRFLVWTSKKSLDAFIASTQSSVNGKVKIRLHKGNATVIGRFSENNSLYREDLATYSQNDIFNHKQAEDLFICGNV